MAEKKSIFSEFSKGLVKENPVLRLVLGTCPTLALTSSVISAFCMGIAATIVLVCSNVVISALRNIIPGQVRIPCYIVLIASFVTIVQLVIKAFLPALDAALGMFIPLIVVNCIIFARAESFAFKNPPMLSIADGLGMGLGFTFAITLLSVIREVIGNGTFFGATVMPAGYQPMAIMLQVPGGFVTLGLLLVSMGTYRSPAVALMPDVTVKPLRSKGNAVINLMGTAGGILSLVLGIVFATSSVQNAMMSYTVYYGVIAAIMENLFPKEHKSRYEWQPQNGCGYAVMNGCHWSGLPK